MAHIERGLRPAVNQSGMTKMLSGTSEPSRSNIIKVFFYLRHHLDLF